MRTALSLVIVAIALAACTSRSGSMNADAHLAAGADSTRGEFFCRQSTSGACDFTIFLEKCPEPKSYPQLERSDCTRQILYEFTLSVGHSRVYDALPVGVRYCARARGSSEEPICPPSPPSVAPNKPKPQVT